MLSIQNFWKNLQTQRKINQIVRDAWMHTDKNMYDCVELADMLTVRLDKEEIPYKVIDITTNPPGEELCHVGYRHTDKEGNVKQFAQYGHRVVETKGLIFDPYFTKRLTLDEYLIEAYDPPEDVDIVAVYQ